MVRRRNEDSERFSNARKKPIPIFQIVRFKKPARNRVEFPTPSSIELVRS